MSKLSYYETRLEMARETPMRRLILSNFEQIACILTLHGVVVSGSSIYKAYSMLELIESNAFRAIAKKLI